MHLHMYTVKPVLNDHSQKEQKLVFKTNHRLMQVKRYETFLNLNKTVQPLSSAYLNVLKYK